MKNPKDQIILMSPHRQDWERKYIPTPLPIEAQIEGWKESPYGDVRYYDGYVSGLMDGINFSDVVDDTIIPILEILKLNKEELDKKVIAGVPGITRYMHDGNNNAVFRRDGYGGSK